jgi:hypothetical protein
LLEKGGEPRSTRSHFSIYQLMFRPESSPHPSAITTSYIYTSSSPSFSSKVEVLRDRENFQTFSKFPSPPPHLTLKHLCFIVFGIKSPSPEPMKLLDLDQIQPLEHLLKCMGIPYVPFAVPHCCWPQLYLAEVLELLQFKFGRFPLPVLEW